MSVTLIGALGTLALHPAALPQDTMLARAVAYIEAAAREHMRSEDTPGLALAVVADGRIVAARGFGVADLATGAPVTPDTRFLAGSISKAFTAVALLQLVEEGQVELDRPVANYLPWFKVRSPGGAITLHHLLTHTAGLPRDRSDLPSSPYTAVALRDRELLLGPGEHYAYSNIGYQLLSLVVEEVEGRLFAEAVRARILQPLGLNATLPAVTQESRLVAATGYQYLFDDRPPVPGTPLVPVAWSEYTAGDANIVTTAPDLARFLVALLSQGDVPGRRLMQPASFSRLVQRTVRASDLGPDLFYGYGVILGNLESDPVLWHSGGMPGFRAMMIGDLDERVGIVLLMNGPGEPRRLGEYALRALIAARRGREPPPVPVAAPPDSIPGAEAMAGTYVDSTGRRLALEASRGRLLLLDGTRRIPLYRAGRDAFVTGDSGWALFPFRLVRENDRIVELVHGPRWFRLVGVGDRRSPPAPAAWQSFVGHYRGQVPYYSNYRVILRRGELRLVSPEGKEELLVPIGGRDFRVGQEEGGVERVRFEDVVSARALRMSLSGTDYYRSTSP
jgi:CubicO group peptidase (beta-lactamase class C family)